MSTREQLNTELVQALLTQDGSKIASIVAEDYTITKDWPPERPFKELYPLDGIPALPEPVAKSNEMHDEAGRIGPDTALGSRDRAL